MNKKPVKKTTKKKATSSQDAAKTKPRPSSSPPSKDNGKIKLELKDSSLNGKLLHVSISTDLDEEKDVDELHEKVEKRIETKLKANGVKNCIVFVSGPNIKLSLM